MMMEDYSMYSYLFDFVFKGGWIFHIHSKGAYKHPNDFRNHPE
eukprot:UN08681